MDGAEGCAKSESNNQHPDVTQNLNGGRDLRDILLDLDSSGPLNPQAGRASLGIDQRTTTAIQVGRCVGLFAITPFEWSADQVAIQRFKGAVVLREVGP